MSAVIQNEYTGNGSTTTYSFTFPYLKTSDIKASLDAVETTAFSLPNATTVQFNTAPTNGAKIKIFRETGVDDLTATFYAGSAIKSEDLNDNFTQNLYKTQEVGARAISALGGTMTGNLTLDTQADLVFEGSTANDHETTIKVVDPTADRTITFPNVTGTVVTTGDTGTVSRTMIANDAINGTKINDDSIDSEHYVDGSIDAAHLNSSAVTTSKINNNAVDESKLASGSVTTPKLGTDSVTTAKIVDGNITANKLATNSVTEVKIASGSVTTPKLGTNSITTAKIVDGNITLAKMADDSVGTAELVDGSVDTARLADNSVTLAKMTDSSVGTSELVNDSVTNAKIADDQIDSEHYVDGSNDTAHIADSQITTAKLANTAVEASKIAFGAITSDKIAANSIGTSKISDDNITTVKIANDAVTTAKIADSELKTLAGMQSGTASKLADSTALTADIADLNQIDGLTKQTTISDSDASFPTSGAVVDYVAAQIAPLGGLEVIANEVSFPNTQPSSGVVISISDTGGVVVNGSGVSTTGRTVGGSTVTINGFPASLQSKTMADSLGLMVSSTGSGQVYNYHKLLAKEADVEQLSNDINDFASRYRVGSSNPTSSLDNGDLFFNTSTGKLLVYNGTNSAWEEAQSIGNFFISTFTEAFDGSRTQFTLSNAPTNVQQVILSLNGVIQKPGTAFTLSGSTVTLASAPASGTDYFAVVMGSTVNIGTPSNNTVSTSVLQNGAVTNDKVSAGAAIAGTKISPDFGSQTVTTTGTVHGSLLSSAQTGTGGILKLARTGTANGEYQFKMLNDSGNDCSLTIRDEKAGATRFAIESNGDISIPTDSKKLKLGAGTDGDLQIYHDGSTNIINGQYHPIEVRHQSEVHIKCVDDGAVELYHDNDKKLLTRDKGITIEGGVRVLTDSTITGTPYNYLYGYAGNDLKNGITVEGNEAAIELLGTASGDHSASVVLRNLNDGFALINNNDQNRLEIKHFTASSDNFNAHGSGNGVSLLKTSATFNESGAVELFHNGVKKVETNSTGLRLQGATADNLFESGRIRLAEHSSQMLGGYVHYDGSANKFFLGVHPSTDSTTGNDVNGIELYRESADMYVRLNHGGNQRFKTSASGASMYGTLAFPTDGDAGTNNDGGITLGASADLHIYHDGNDSHIKETGTGDLVITGKNNIKFLDYGTNETMCKMVSEGSVELYHDNSVRLRTTSTGVKLEHDTRPVLHMRCNAPGSGNTDPRALINFTSQNGDNDADMYRINFWEGEASDEIASSPHASIRYHGDATHGGSGAISFRNENSTALLYMSRNGNGGTSGSWSVGSDSRKKENITTVANPLTKLSQLRGVDFKWLEKYGGHDCSGVIAQEVEAVLPHLVNEHGAEKNQDGSTMKSVNYDGLWGVMIEAVKELTTKVTTLETKVAALEAA